MPAFDKRGFIYIRKSDEYPGNHPDWSIMAMNGFTVPVVRPLTEDPLAAETVKSAKKANLYPALWEVPKKFNDGSREGALDFANRLNSIIKGFDDNELYLYAIVCDNEDLDLPWHQVFAPAFAQMRTRKKILSIDPLKGDMWNEHNMYSPYVENGYSIDIQCYNSQMDYYDAARCSGVVAGTPGVKPWQIRLTLPPGKLAEIKASNILKMGPVGIGLFAPNVEQLKIELPWYGEHITSAVLPQVLAYK